MGCAFEGNKESGRCCYISTGECVHSRRCFMTGEYCSKQSNVQREREKQYGGKEITITAFVIMNFSDMSDVVYKWRIKPFIEGLAKYMCYDPEDGRLYCSENEKDERKERLCRVAKVRVVRSDSDPSSNYVICNRICQQMQIADLVIVDVTSPNANVFYEFGMAVAFGKLILPICYSESFYKIDQRGFDWEKDSHHIGCYPWRKELFEYYGIRYKRKKAAHTCYFELSEIVEEGFSDVKYERFPYHEKLKEGSETVGRKIYNKLKTTYNEAEPKDNTLVVYTLERFLNEQEAGLCIVNFYKNITSRMREENCFCGDRVGVLVQSKAIPEMEKDVISEKDRFTEGPRETEQKKETEQLRHLDYNIGEIIHIGVNQATYMASEERLKTEDGLEDPQILLKKREEEKPSKEQKDRIRRFVKEHIGNRGMLIYPNNPVYVNRMKNQIQEKILDDFSVETTDCLCCNPHAFCFYHVMLRNLRYTNEIVVDITDNSCQSLFWLGAAHGSDVYAITVLHERTEEEQKIVLGTAAKRSRNVFDVAGLWTAILTSKETEDFYRQVAMAQLGIERHSKLMAVRRNDYEKSMREYLYAFEVTCDKDKLKDLLEEKREEEKQLLESYYRKRFWNPMLKYNRLRIYLTQQNDRDSRNEPRVRTAKWDFDAVAALSNYLSKRTVIGEYLIQALSEDEEDQEVKQTNSICVGALVKPFGMDLPNHIYGQMQQSGAEDQYGNSSCGISQRKCLEIPKWECSNSNCGRYSSDCPQNPCKDKDEKRIYKGFQKLGKEADGLYTQHPRASCTVCTQNRIDGQPEIFYKKENAEQATKCQLGICGSHIEIAQLILWRETPKDRDKNSLFWVGMCGSSGPATFALSALLVDEKQKQAFFSEYSGKNEEKAKEGATRENIKSEPPKRKAERYLLSQLQEAARREFTDYFLRQLGQELEKISGVMTSDNKAASEPQKNRYFNLVQHAAAYYLSTVLYRYFLPFLSETDIIRIYNGMQMFIHSMKTAGESPFALEYSAKRDSQYQSSISQEIVLEIVRRIPEVLLKALRSFRGLEVFYKVTVGQESDGSVVPKRDQRIVQGIEMMQEEEEGIHCIFLV